MEDEAQAVVKYLGEEVGPEVTKFMGTVAGTPARELGELVGDEVRFLRLKRSVKHAVKAKKLLDEAGLKPQQVPLRTLVPLMEGASLEEDENLTDKWAALLANAASSEADAVPASFPNMLKELEPTQAKILDRMFATLMQIDPSLRPEYGVEATMFCHELGLAEPVYRLHADNLIRLRLVRSVDGMSSDDVAGLTLTYMGEAFVRACRPPGLPDPPVRHRDRAALEKQSAVNKQRAESIRRARAAETGD